MKIHLPSHCAHAKDWSRGAPGKFALTSSAASSTKGAGRRDPALPGSAPGQLPARTTLTESRTAKRTLLVFITLSLYLYWKEAWKTSRVVAGNYGVKVLLIVPTSRAFRATLNCTRLCV